MRHAAKSGKGSKLAKVDKSALALVSDHVRDVPARLDQAVAAFGQVRRRTEQLVKKNPLGALAGASALGYVVAKLK